MENSSNNLMKVILFIGVILLIVVIILYVLMIRKEETSPQAPNEVIIPTITSIVISTPSQITNTPPPTLTQEQATKQLEANQNWANDSQEVYGKYSWIDKLPLKTNDYFVYFDLSTEKFIGKIYKKDDQEGTKTQIVAKLKELGINTDSYTFDWQIKE